MVKTFRVAKQERCHGSRVTILFLPLEDDNNNIIMKENTTFCDELNRNTHTHMMIIMMIQ